MPTYPLRCGGCGESFEVFLTRFLRDEERVCPACGAAAEQVLTSFVTAGPARGDPAPRIVGFGGRHRCGAHGPHAHG